MRNSSKKALLSLFQPSLTPMKQSVRPSFATAFSFYYPNNALQSNHFKMVATSVFCLCFACQNETPNHSTIASLTMYMGTMNWRSYPWGGISFSCEVVTEWFKVKSN